MPSPWFLLAVVVALVGTGLGGYRHGYSSAEGDAAIARQSAIDQAVADGKADLERESARAVEAERARDRLSRRLKEIDRETPPPRPGCRWTDAEFRLLESRRAAIAGDREPGAGPLPGAMPRHAGNGPGSDGDREVAPGLGLRLPRPTAGVPGLGQPATAH